MVDSNAEKPETSVQCLKFIIKIKIKIKINLLSDICRSTSAEPRTIFKSSKIFIKISISTNIRESKIQNLNYKQNSRMTKDQSLAANKSRIYIKNLNLH